MTRLDSNATPVWEVAVTIRGASVPTLSPLDAQDRSVANFGARKPGVAVRLWRWIAGEPRRVVSDAHETEELRRTVLAFVPREYAALVLEISGGELLAVLGNYIGAQNAWFDEIQRRARAEAERTFVRMRPETAAAAPTDDSTRAGRDGVIHRVPPMPLVPGEPLPAWLQGDVLKGGTG